MASSLEVSDDLAAYDEEEPEVRGTLTYRPAVEMLPKTKRTEELQKQRIETLKRRKQEAEDLRRQKEQEEAQRRLREQEAKKLKAQQEQKKKEEERRRREEEEQRKKMEGGLDQILDALAKNTSAPHITVCGIDVSSVRLRLLTQALEKNLSCQSIDLSRKGLNDEDGVSIAGMLKKNGKKEHGPEGLGSMKSIGEGLEKLECEGNSLGVKAASSIAESLASNETLRCLNLEGNNLTASGNDQTGVIALAHALRGNKTLRVLLLGKNHITQQGGEHFVRAIEQNDTITMLDLTGNELGVEQLRRIDEVIKKNREKLSALRRAERRERFTLYNEEFKCRQHDMQVEAARLELEAREERRLNRMKAKFEEWREMCEAEVQKEAEDLETLTTEAQERRDAGGKKKGKKGKKKK